MVNKYKLIKEYPGSRKIGYISDCCTSVNSEHYLDGNWFDPALYPEYWEKIVEKDYEILQFICKEKRGVENVGTILTKQPDGSFWIYPHWTEEAMLRLSHYAIYSVKRLSDGEIFAIGDICDGVSYERRPILEFKMVGNTLSIRQEFGHTKLSNLKKSKTPLFTTEDGVDVYEGDDFWFTNDLFELKFWDANKMDLIENNSTFLSNKQKFHVMQNCLDYIDRNKPQFSKKDMIEFGKYVKDCYQILDSHMEPKFNRFMSNKKK